VEGRESEARPERRRRLFRLATVTGATQEEVAMQKGSKLLAVAMIAIVVGLLSYSSGVGQTEDKNGKDGYGLRTDKDKKGGDIEKRLEKIEQALQAIQKQLKENERKTGWQYISDPKDQATLVIMNLETGKIKFIYPISGRVVEK